MQLTLPILIGIALADSVNPVSFGLLIELMSNKKTKQGPEFGMQYVSSFISAYIALGLVGIFLIRMLASLSGSIYSVLGAIIFLLGLLELNRILGLHEGLKRFSSDPHQRIKKYAQELKNDPSLNVVIGINTALREFVYTGGFYLALMALLTLQGTSLDSFVFLFLYNAIVAFPLVLIYQTSKWHESVDEFKLWNTDLRKSMMIGIASLQVVLGIWLLFWWFV